MRTLSSLLTAFVTVVIAAAAVAAPPPASLDDLLTPHLARQELPAVAAAVVRNGEIVAIGAVGTRKLGEKIPVTIDDRFHLGSDTKAMTALIAAMLVEEGKLRWDTTLAKIFPELVPNMVPGLGAVTLQQFLSHTSGLPSDNDEMVKVLERSLTQDGDLDEVRAWLVKEWIKQPLATTPGTAFAYANMNYVIVGAMIERVTGRSWEELIRERVFTPLGLKSAGLGPQTTIGTTDAPLGHAMVDGKIRAYKAGPGADNYAILGPAGVAHMSVADFARWAGWNAGEGKRGPALVKPETLKKLHARVISMTERKDAAPGTPHRGGYGLGWGQLEVDWAAEPLAFHGGSNGKNLAHIWLDPANDLAIVVVTNISSPKANEALFAIAPELYQKFGPKRGSAGTAAPAK